MAFPPPPQDKLDEAVRVFKETGSKAKAAEAAGIPRTTIYSWLTIAAQRGMLGGEPIAQRELPAGHIIKGVSSLVDAEGNLVQQWIKTREGELDPQKVAEWLKGAFDDVEPAEPIAAPAVTSDDLLTLLPCGDWHLGMFAWGRETAENWDLRIAEETIGQAVEDTVDRSPASGVAVVLSGGDLFHADNKENQTARSGHALDVDGRYQKVVEAGCRLMVRTVDACLRRHRNVIVRILPGNHDEHSAVAVAYYLQAYYRQDPRVTVDTDPSVFWWHHFGKVLIGATHGDKAKIGQLPSIMAHRQAEAWGKSRYRYGHGFHLHHSSKIATEGGGVICETHQAPIPQDAWHFGSGFLSGRSIQAITYHAELGEVARVRTAILDAGQ